MMVLLFSVNDDRYGISVTDVMEVIPNVPLQKTPRAPAYFSGLLNYRGLVVPVIDLSILMGGERVRNYLSTRIILVNYPKSRTKCIGLLGEEVIETIKLSEEALSGPVVNSENGAIIGSITIDGKGMIQHVNVEQLLTPEIRDSLCRHEEAHADRSADR